jgi:hypothetical protein
MKASSMGGKSFTNCLEGIEVGREARQRSFAE